MGVYGATPPGRQLTAENSPDIAATLCARAPVNSPLLLEPAEIVGLLFFLFVAVTR